MNNNKTATDVALIAVFAALVTVLSLTPAIPIGSVGVPITLQTLAIYLTGLILGPWRGGLSVLLYLVIGFAGLPVFAGGSGGLGVFAKPSIGYLLAFPIGALIAGLISYWALRQNKTPRFLWFFLATLGASVAIHVCGWFGMMANAKLGFQAAILADMPFWPGDLLKGLVACAIAIPVHKAFSQLAYSAKELAYSTK